MTMYVSKLSLRNYRIFRDEEILFDSRLTVLAGINGAGKSTVLKALAKLLSWPSRRFGSIKANGVGLDRDSEVSDKEKWANISLVVKENENEYSWNLATTVKGTLEQERSNFAAVNKWALKIQQMIQENEERTSVPLFVFYPVDRAIIDIPLRIKGKHRFNSINALDDNMLSQSRFRVFFEWFRNQEDLENETRFVSANSAYRDKSLEAVRNALSKLLPGNYKKLMIRRKPLRMEMEKDDRMVRVDGLSDGEKCLIALVGDLARRLAMANPGLDNPLDGEGVVLIDEIDLHLHPAWQRNVVNRLIGTFPNCQFIMTTHSPQVLGDVPASNILLLDYTVKGVTIHHPMRSLGLSSNEAVDELMSGGRGEILSQNKKVAEDLRKIYRLIEAEEYDGAENAIDELQREVSDIPSVREAKAYLENMR